MATDETYNGWRNYETWNVALWLNNQEAYYNDIRHIVRLAQRHEYADELPARFRDYVEQIVLGDNPGTGPQVDLLTHALDRVDWDAVVGSFTED